MIITNPNIKMSDLEVRARAGDVLAQDELERQAMASANVTKEIQRRAGLSREQAVREASFRRR